ncbi:MAG: prepilin-type N-terminal cleavage/methylation domain-containing protein [Verrucomicrobiales bacterium]|nr:prepilin-type N-terminal cleavage/methylation domain-containing protein [Verrucomicrobiales bacterium]
MRLPSPRPLLPRATTLRRGFTLLEVSLAMALLFGITFVLLQITSTNLRIARALQHTSVDASSLAAEISLTNRLEEGSESGDFGDLHPNHEWRREITMVGTNGLYEVRFEVYRQREREPDSELVILLFRPDSATRAGGGSTRVGGGR